MRASTVAERFLECAGPGRGKQRPYADDAPWADGAGKPSMCAGHGVPCPYGKKRGGTVIESTEGQRHASAKPSRRSDS